MKYQITIFFLLVAFASARQVDIAPKLRTTTIAPGTNRVSVLASSVLIDGVRRNVFRSMAESNALRIVDVNVTNVAPSAPPVTVTVSFETPWNVLVRTPLDGAPIARVFPATVSFTDTNSGERYYQVERPALHQSVFLSWEKSPTENVAGYHIYAGTNSGRYTTQFSVDGNTATRRVDGLDEGAVYYFAVSAFDGTGAESDLSNEASFDVPSYEVTPTISLK